MMVRVRASGGTSAVEGLSAPYSRACNAVLRMLCFWYDGFLACLFLTFSWGMSGGGWIVYHPTVWRREAVNGAMPVKRDARGRGGDALRGGHCGTQSAQLVHRSHHVVRTTEDTVVFNRTAMA